MTNKEEMSGRDFSFDTTDDEFMIAFSLDTFSNGVKHDPRFVKWVGRVYVTDNDGNENVVFLPTHDCTE